MSVNRRDAIKKNEGEVRKRGEGKEQNTRMRLVKDEDGKK